MSRKWLAVVAKAAVSAVLIWYLLGKVDIAQVTARAARLQPLDAVLSLLTLALQMALVTARWRLVGRLIKARLALGTALRILWIGMFFNQTLPSSVGGDAVRAWLLTREGISTGKAVSLVLCDRVVGLVALLALIFLMLPLISTRLVSDMAVRTTLTAIAVAGMAGFSFFMVAGEKLAGLLRRWSFTRPFGNLATDFRQLFLRPGSSTALVALSFLVHGFTVLSVVLLAWGLDLSVSFVDCLLVMPAVILITTLPVSIAGWGLRESAMVGGFGLIGMAAGDALALSVLFGLAQIVVALPGGAIWLAGRPRAAVVTVTRDVG